MIDYSQELNAEQLAAVTHPGGPMLIVAGAGSGKTRVLTYRLAWLVERGESPHGMLLMTFTNRAAREMLARAEHLLGEGTRRLLGGTFHHVGNLMLRRFASRLELNPEYSIIDQDDAKKVMRQCVVDSGHGESRRQFPSQGTLLAIAGFTQNTLESLSTVLEQRYPMFERKKDAIQQVLKLYCERKREMQTMDFDDLLGHFHRLLLEHEDVRRLLADRFRHILVDEYQDTNRVQGEIVDLLAASHRNLCVVGDDAQSIYSFRGASFANIIEFQKRYADARIFRLEHNYRSRPPILALASASIAGNQCRWRKKLLAVRRGGALPFLVLCRDGNQQAQLVVEHVRELRRRGVAPERMAVLYRSHFHAMEIQLQLQRSGIPFQVRGGLRFFEQAHVKDLLSFLRVACNWRDQAAWLRLLPMLPRVGVRTARRICDRLAGSGQALPGALAAAGRGLVPAPARQEFDALLGALSAVVANLSRPGAALEAANHEFYYRYMIANYDSPQRRREDLQGVINFAGQYSAATVFLSEITLATDYDREGRAGMEKAAQQRLILSTVHQAKGLEWDAVFMPWLVENRFPAAPSLDTAEAVEEERRVFHVAATRAENCLVLYVPEGQQGRGYYWQPLQPSRFVEEVSPSLMRTVDARKLQAGDCLLFAGQQTGSSGGANPAVPAAEAARPHQDADWSDDGLPVIVRD